jgi:4a-hydroxytetrahydrobiopterin dehydratase
MQPEEVGAMAKLSKAEVSERLKRLKGWRLHADTIKKEYQFPSFPKAIKFVNKVAEISEQADHHPDILICFRKVTLSLSTHDEGGITQKDFKLAEQLEEANGKRSKEVE